MACIKVRVYQLKIYFWPVPSVLCDSDTEILFLQCFSPHIHKQKQYKFSNKKIGFNYSWSQTLLLQAPFCRETLASQFSHLNRLFSTLFLGFKAFVLNTNELWLVDPVKIVCQNLFRCSEYLNLSPLSRAFTYWLYYVFMGFPFNLLKVTSHETEFFRFLLEKC